MVADARWAAAGPRGDRARAEGAPRPALGPRLGRGRPGVLRGCGGEGGRAAIPHCQFLPCMYRGIGSVRARVGRGKVTARGPCVQARRRRGARWPAGRTRPSPSSTRPSRFWSAQARARSSKASAIVVQPAAPPALCITLSCVLASVCRARYDLSSAAHRTLPHRAYSSCGLEAPLGHRG